MNGESSFALTVSEAGLSQNLRNIRTRHGKYATATGIVTTSVATLCTLLLGATTLAAPPAQAPAVTHQLNIPPQDLGVALKALGAAANEQVLFSEDVVAGLRSTEVKGAYSTEEAVTLLLKGSGLKADRTASGVLLIRSPSTKGNATPPLRVRGERVEERGRGEDAFPSLSARHARGNTSISGGDEKKGLWSRFRLAQADTSSRSVQNASSRDEEKKVIGLRRDCCYRKSHPRNWSRGLERNGDRSRGNGPKRLRKDSRSIRNADSRTSRESVKTSTNRTLETRRAVRRSSCVALGLARR